MPLTDQQLRQELVSYGENVPPITQRNREQLRARLEVLRSRPRSPVKTSPTRTRSPNTSATRSTTRSRPVRSLIELSDSETDTSSNEYPSSRSVGRREKIQTRSIAVGRDTDRVTPTSSSNVTADVEQSIARHRREIQQLIDSARDRTRAANTNVSSIYEPPSTTPLRPTAIPSRQRQALKPDLNKPKQPSWFNRTGQTIQSFWKLQGDTIISVLRSLIGGLLLAVVLIYLVTKGSELIPHRKGTFINFFFNY
jgi:hypothetical protein